MAEAIKVVDVRGVDTLTAILLKFTNDVKNLNGFGTEVGKLIASNASALAPRKTGALAASIGSIETKEGLQVYAGSETVPYAGVIEYGWPAKGKQAKPFLMPAVQNNLQMIVQKYEDGIKSTIRKYNLD
jgi:hypothetical protein